MFRTRDFILIFVTIVFLLMAISVTVLSRENTTSTDDGLTFVVDTATEYSSTVYAGETLSRAERLAEMRRRIAADSELMLTEPESAAEISAVPSTTEAVAVAETGPQRCPGYIAYTGSWPAQGVELTEAEGARLVYTEVTVDPVSQPSATSSTPQTVEAQREVLVQLPMRSMPVSTSRCLSSDVIGVAQDGSLIRNNEVGLYSVFGEGTLIGYALDGFPIYGVSNTVTDACGGMVELGQYRYYLSDQRETILRCFSGQPVSL